jgi:hypothetical protein
MFTIILMMIFLCLGCDSLCIFFLLREIAKKKQTLGLTFIPSPFTIFSSYHEGRMQMDAHLTVKTKWNKINKLKLAALFSLCPLIFLCYFFEQDPEFLKEGGIAVADVIKSFIWYMIAHHCAYEKNGHKFIFVFFILQLIGIAGCAISMLGELFSELPSLFENGLSNWTVLYISQNLLIGGILTLLYVLSAKWSFQLFRLNKAIRKTDLQHEQALPAN